jgi:hypothetical protein
MARIVAGNVFVLAGAVIGGAGWVLAIVGLVPLLAGALDVCMFAPLFRMPFSGARFVGAPRGESRRAPVTGCRSAALLRSRARHACGGRIAVCALHKRGSQGIAGPAPAPRSCSCRRAAIPKRHSPPPGARCPRRPSGPRTGGSRRCRSGAVRGGKGHRCVAQHARWGAGSQSGPVPATVPHRPARRALLRPRAPQRPAVLSASASLAAGAATPERRAGPPGQGPEHARRVPRSGRRTPRGNDKAVPAYAVPFAYQVTYGEDMLQRAGPDRPVNPARRSVAL